MEAGPAGTALEEDHRDIDARFEAFAASLSTDRVDVAALGDGTRALRHHIFVEEEIHFPVLRGAGVLGPILVMLREHGEIWDLLDRLEQQVRDEAPSAQLAETWQRLFQVLEAHNAKEEQILYPTGDQILSPEQADEICTALAAGRTPAGWVCEMAGRT